MSSGKWLSNMHSGAQLVSLVLDHEGGTYILEHQGRGRGVDRVRGPYSPGDALALVEEESLWPSPPSRAPRGIYFHAEIISIETLRVLATLKGENLGSKRAYDKR